MYSMYSDFCIALLCDIACPVYMGMGWAHGLALDGG